MGWAERAKRRRRSAVQDRRPKPAVAALRRGAAAMPGFAPAPFVELPPGIVARTRDDADAFMLALALAFNDLKGAEYWIHLLDKHKPVPVQRKPHDAEWVGMRGQASRISF